MAKFGIQCDTSTYNYSGYVIIGPNLKFYSQTVRDTEENAWLAMERLTHDKNFLIKQGFKCVPCECIFYV